jgi:hypothetical protein
LPLLVLQRTYDFFKQVSHCVRNIFVFFKLCTWLLHVYRLYKASGFFQGELSRAAQAWHCIKNILGNNLAPNLLLFKKNALKTIELAELFHTFE